MVVEIDIDVVTLDVSDAAKIRVLTKIGTDAVSLAREEVLEGPKTGRTYTWRGAKEGEKPDSFVTIRGRRVPIINRNRPHQASKAGQAPANDTGQLLNSIKTDRNKFEQRVFADAPYSKFLADGTRFMGKRPFIEPSVERSILRNDFFIVDNLVRFKVSRPRDA